jgi:hypothetical protein
MNTKYVLAAAASLLLLSACAKSEPVTTQSSGSAATAAGGTVLVAAGTDFYGRLRQPIGTKSSKNGDKFTLAQTDTFLHKSPALHGMTIEGHLDNIQAAGPMRKPAMTIVFDDIVMPDGTKAPVNVQLLSVNAFEPKTHHLRTIGLMIGGAIAGHAVAKHTGVSHGSLAGAAAGYVMSQELKTDIAVPAGTVIELHFKSPVTM